MFSGTDESTIINILANRTLNERLQIRQLFKTMIGKVQPIKYGSGEIYLS